MQTTDKPATFTVVHPHGTTLFVREVEPETKTAGGILLTKKTAKDVNLMEGEVVAVGPGWRHEKDGYTMPLPWKIGDRVLFFLGRLACPYKVNSEELMVIDEMDIVSSLEERPVKAG